MTNFGLETKYLEFLKTTLKKQFSNENIKFYIFGSRAKGTQKEYSDIDIAIDNQGQKILTDVLLKAISEFENSTFPYEVDIIDLNSIEANFKSLIISDLVEL